MTPGTEKGEKATIREVPVNTREWARRLVVALNIEDPPA